MALNEMLLPEFDQEAATTRRLLERVPAKDAAAGRAALAKTTDAGI